MSSTVITKPKVNIDPALLDEIQAQIHEAGQVVIHFLYYTPPAEYSSYIRIWPTTFLYDKGSAHSSELVHVENITYYPQWHECVAGSANFFTLIFSGLPRSCTSFDFIEHCTNQSGAFAVYDIARSESDVYFIRIS